MEKSMTRATIKKWGINGEGIAYVNKKCVFIPGALPNELVEFHITEDKEKYAMGELDRVLTLSSDRRHPLCNDWLTCGGCSLMPVQYKAQCKMKEEILEEALYKYARYKGKINPIIKNPNPLGYRNSCKLPFGYNEDHELCTGMYQRDSNQFVPMNRCYTHSKHIERVRKEVQEILKSEKAYDKKLKRGFRTLVLKEFDEKIQIIFVTGRNAVPSRVVEACSQIENVVSIWQSIKTDIKPDVFGDEMIHLYGNETIELQLNDYKLSILPKSFFQLNTKQAIQLYEYVESITPKCNCIVEAYSGIGAISLFVHDKAKEVIGIEEIEDAVDNAMDNAEVNDIDNVYFMQGDAGRMLSKLDQKVDTLIVDPPRVGLDNKMKDTILDSDIKTLIYISCNPSTLAKDINVLSKKYRIQSVQPFDMFSQTSHVETVVKLVKSDGRKEYSKPRNNHRPRKDYKPRKQSK